MTYPCAHSVSKLRVRLCFGPRVLVDLSPEDIYNKRSQVSTQNFLCKYSCNPASLLQQMTDIFIFTPPSTQSIYFDFYTSTSQNTLGRVTII